MVPRLKLTSRLKKALRRNPVTALLGPRQCGKTTLAQVLVQETEPLTYFDLEDPSVLASLENPMTVLGDSRGLVVIDEVQRRPELFPIIRVLADRKPLPARFLILGSASPEMLRQSSETLAGRIEFVEMGGFDADEVGMQSWRRLWWRGGFPRSYLADSDEDSASWREQFIRTFLERDIPQLGLNLAPLMLRRFWTMVAHYHGQTWNASQIGASLGVSDHTARRYLDILAGAYMVRLLPPWHENLAKRQRRAPKVFLRDSGLLHALLGIVDPTGLLSHPKCGASWEGFALEQVVRNALLADLYYWAVHSGPELDLLIVQRGGKIGVEFKFADAPRMRPAWDALIRDLDLRALWIVYPGVRRYRITESIVALPLVMASEILASS